MKEFLFLLIMIFSLSFAETEKINQLTPEDYLDEAISLIRNNALYADNVDWEKEIPLARSLLQFSATPKDTYPIIQNFLQKLNDNHSFFRNPLQYKKNKSKKVENNPRVESKKIHNFGYLKIPGLYGYMTSENRRYARQVQAKIAHLDSSNVKGWIIDLRENNGGNMWPMMLGLAPLLGERNLGFLKMKDREYGWSLQNGAVLMDTLSVLALDHSSYSIKAPNYPIAVLIGENTLSSGEALVIAFKTRQNTKIFGLPTRGLSTVTTSHKLADDAQIILVEGIYLDSDKNEYGGKIQPDVIVENKVLTKAVKWLQKKIQ